MTKNTRDRARNNHKNYISVLHIFTAALNVFVQKKQHCINRCQKVSEVSKWLASMLIQRALKYIHHSYMHPREHKECMRGERTVVGEKDSSRVSTRHSLYMSLKNTKTSSIVRSASFTDRISKRVFSKGLHDRRRPTRVSCVRKMKYLEEWRNAGNRRVS